MSDQFTPNFQSTKLQSYVYDAGSSEQCAPVSSAQGCPNKNWAEVEYFHVNGTPVKGTPYYLTRPGSTDTIAKGVLDANGYAFVGNLPDGLTTFDLYYTTDPQDFTIFEDKKPKPHGLKPIDPNESVPIKALRYAAIGLHIYMTAREEVAKWVWEAIQGDFKEDRTMGQIAFDSVVSLIPVVDQVADVRDIAANLKALIWDGKYKEFDPWFSLVTTLIGCIPEIGTAIKGSCRLVVKAGKEVGQKLMKSGIDVGFLIRFLNTIGEGNAVKWLNKHVDQFKKYAQDVLDQVYELFKKIKGKIEDLKKTLLNKADDYFKRLLANLEAAREAAEDFVFYIFAFCEKEIRELIQKIKNYWMKGKARAKTSIQQRDLAARLADAKKRKAALKTERMQAWIRTVAKEAGMDTQDVEKLIEYCIDTDSRLIVRFTNTDGLKFQKAGKELLEKHGVSGFLPKPLDVKLKSAKPPHPHAGLVVEPPYTKGPDGKKIYSKDDQTNIDQLKKLDYDFDEKTGILKDKDGNAFYGDYDLQGVQRKVTDQDGKEIHLEELSNKEDSDAIKEINKGMRPDAQVPEKQNQIQHGAENDNHVLRGPDNQPALDDTNHQIRATEQEIQEGKSMLGRQHGDNEKYVIISADGGLDMLDSPYDLYKFYTNPSDAFPWRYTSKAAMEAKDAAQKASK